MLALYLHIPFCLSKCHYCAFNSQPLPAGGGGQALVQNYLGALRRELQQAAQNQTPGAPYSSAVSGLAPGLKKCAQQSRTEGLAAAEREGLGSAKAGQRPTTGDRLETTGRESLRSIYFGGGTPTILDPSDLCSLLSLSKRFFNWEQSIEITVEANPATVNRAGLAELRRAGVNRLSLGAQSFAAPELQLLGRRHGAAEIEAACRDARAAGFANLSLDLIYGLPGQTLGGWRENLQRALDLRPEHLSAYGLKLEEGTLLAEEVAAGMLPEQSEDEGVAMWYETQRLTSAAGLERYEISNYARPGQESRHNLAYWLNQPYLALGAGASGHVRGERREVRGENGGHWRSQCQPKNPTSHIPPLTSQFVRYTNYENVTEYIASVARGERPRAWEENQTPEQERADTVMMGLRLTGGLDRLAFQQRFGHPFEFFYGSQLAIMERDGLMDENERVVFLTERGLLLSNWVLAELI
jgi:oxygen-independent coproporphyrinogen-3 oxidase